MAKKRAIKRRASDESDIVFTDYKKWKIHEFDSNRKKAFNFYYKEWKKADLYKAIFTWMRKNKYTTKQVALVKNSNIQAYVGSWCKVLLDGCPDYYEAHAEYWESLPCVTGNMEPISTHIKRKVDEAIAATKPVIKVKEENKNVISIQDRIYSQTLFICEDIDNWLDEGYANPKDFDPMSFNIAAHFALKKANTKNAKQIIDFYKPELDEFKEYLNVSTLKKKSDLDKQLIDGYAHYGKAKVKKFIKALERIIAECELILQLKKATRKTRVKKAPSKEKLVSKLKYKVVDNDYKLASVNPLELVDSNEVWLFNTKNRKLAKYIADELEGPITVKGTTLQGFSNGKSLQKTLRKPEEQLKEFQNCGKVALRKFMDNISTKEQAVNGRLNNDTIILKVN